MSFAITARLRIRFQKSVSSSFAVIAELQITLQMRRHKENSSVGTVEG